MTNLPLGPLAEKMGISIVSIDEGSGYATMPVEGNTQPFGLLHGGANAVLAEQLGSAMAYLHAQPDSIAVGIEISISHHRSVTAGLVHAHAHAISRGRTLASYHIEISDDANRRLATARLTCMIRPRRESPR